MKHIKPPEVLQDYEYGCKFEVFLAGSIEQGKAVKWQEELVRSVEDLDIVVFNPRRDDWDATWIQSTRNTTFSEQVLWEVEHIKLADLCVFYFDPTTMSPITLLELGYQLGRKANCVVCCPDGFHSKGNVDIMCSMMGVEQVDSLEKLAESIRRHHKQLVRYKAKMV